MAAFAALGLIWWLLLRLCMREPNTTNGLQVNGYDDSGLPG
ncbi:MAG: hypothetical protein ABSB42_08410 [Tepidisphaeraceae bacterium]|jgi:hypothetical protein